VPSDDNNAGHHQLTPICLGIAATLPIFVGVALYCVLITGAEAVLSGESTLLPEVLALVAMALVLIAPLATRVLRSPVLGTLAAFLFRLATGALGLVITILTGDLVWCVTLCVVALLAMVVDWPQRGQTRNFNEEQR
jgi:hypothetical protein